MYEPAPEPAAVPLEAPGKPVLPDERLGAFLEVILCSGFPSQIVLAVILGAFGMKVQTPDGRLWPPFVFTLSLLDAVAVIGLVIFFLRSHGERPAEVLFGHRRAVREVLTGLVVIPAAFALVVTVLAVILVFAPHLHNVARNPLADMLLTRTDTLIFAVVVTVAGGVREEIQRGFALHRFGLYLGGAPVGIVVYSTIFGLGHFEQGTDVAIATGLLGAMWGVLYVVRRSVLAPMVSHAGFNLAQLIKWATL